MPKLKLAFISAVLVAMAVAAQAAGTLRVGMQDDPDALDPARGGTYISSDLWQLQYAGKPK